MTVKNIDLGHFSIQVRNPQLAAELQKVNTDGNDTINLDDIRLPHGVEDRGIQYRLLKKAVAAAFVNAGSISKDQQRSLEDTIDLYVEVQNFRRDVSNWHQWGKVGTYKGRKALVFDQATHCAVKISQLPQAYLPERLSVLTHKLHHVLHGFGQASCLNVNSFPIRTSQQSCDVAGNNYLTGITYTPLHIPVDLQESVQQTVQNYLTGANWLFQFADTYCAGPQNDISWHRSIDVQRLERLDEGSANVHHYGNKLPECYEGP